ncbi:MAG TPA: Flp pilus assembly protein CpaB [Pyrinomonadaceae bacterium]|nr:Flp pilus assembly protein CpaB [Pyrinomonadaceae bacterium]
MRNKRLIIALAGAVLCGVLGVMLITRYLSNVQAYTRDLGNVVVAKVGIQLGEKITAEQLALAPIPNGSAPEGAFRKIEDVVNRVAITPIGVRETVSEMKLAPKGVEGGLSAVIPEGYRAMTVKVDDVVGVSGFVMPGSYVDVVAVIVPQQAQGAQTPGPVSKIVLQQIKVLASGPKLDSPNDQREPTNAKAVTLQVTPEQAERLSLAANEGKLQLVMRSYTDQEASQTRGVNKQSLLTGESLADQPAPKVETEPKPVKARKPVAPKRVAAVSPEPVRPVVQPAPRNSVELIEGSKRREVDMP